MSNLKGLVSISFRSKSVEEIAVAAKNAGIEAIEWGGDVHVPHGDAEAAKYASEISTKYGLKTVHYGSYYKIGYSDPELFSMVLESARMLGAPIIRVWPGMNIHPEELSADEYCRIVDDAKRICDEASDRIIALECHPNSLTEHYKTALKFLSDVDRANLKMLWQPNQNRGFEYDIEALRALLPYIVGVHVFNWVGDRPDKYPLALGREKWQKYMEILSAKELNYMLEFMPDDRIGTLSGEAETLNGFIKKFLEI